MMSDQIVNRRKDEDPAGARINRLPARPRRASRIVMLGLLGVGALAGGYYAQSLFDGEDEEQVQASAQQRNAYTSREECEANYSKEQCTPGQANRPGMGFIPIFWGPFYGAGARSFGTADPGPGRVSQGAFVESRPGSISRRSGFGSTGSTHADGGHA